MNLDTSRHRLVPGTRVGDHLIVRGVLGEGGTAVVYEALHTRLGASVALKVVDVSEEYLAGARARLLREAQVCASLEDSHIPRIYDVGELPDGTPFVVMERVSGRTLENVLLQGPLPLDVAVHVTDDLLLAVEAIEKAGIVHRDIKPPNIILQTSSEGVLRVRLMDFGVSKNVNNDRDSAMLANPSLTQQGAIVGTPHYMAPEQIVGPSVDSRADLYAVGVVAYEMMGGRTPFEGQTTGDVVAAVLHTRPLPLRKLRDVHPELEAWVEKAMAPKRIDRFPSARAMREALRDAWDEHLAYVAASGRSRWSRRARVMAALAVVGAGFALPLPAEYDISTLGQLFGLKPAPTPSAAAAGTSPEAAAPSAQASSASASTASVALQAAVEETGALDAANDVAPSLPQAQGLRQEPGVAAADEPDAERGDDTAAESPSASTKPSLPGVARKRPAGAVGVGAPTGGAAIAATSGAPALPAPTPSEEPERGVLLNDYLKQLDRELAEPPLAPAAPEPGAAAPNSEPAKRTPGQIAPNPFDGTLPDNPYAGQ